MLEEMIKYPIVMEFIIGIFSILIGFMVVGIINFINRAKDRKQFRENNGKNNKTLNKRNRA